MSGVSSYGSALNIPATPPNFAAMDKNEEMLTGKYPAKAHAANVVAYLRRQESNINGVIYLEGQKTRMIEDNDEAMLFRYGPSSHRGPVSQSNINALGNDDTSITSPAAGSPIAVWSTTSKHLV